MDVRTGSITRRFSDLQWYFAKAKNTVHFVSYSPRTITEEEFKAFAYRVLSRAPQLLLEESVQHESLRQLSRVDIEALIEHRTCESLDLPLSLVREHLGAEFSDTGKPAYRARCWSARARCRRWPMGRPHCLSSRRCMR